MLKYFVKVFLISILSGSLLFMDIGIKGIQLQSALAAQSSGESHDRSTTTTVKTNAIDDSNMMATLTMTAVGLLASRLWSCTLTTDMMLAAAGGAIFIAGEALAFFKLKSAIKDMETQITRDKNGNINREQIAALERLKKSYEEAKKTAGTKKMLQMAAAAAFAAAAVMAYTLNTAEQAAMTSCKTALATAGSSCQGLSAPAGSTASMLQALEAGRIIPKPSAAGMATSLTQEASEKTGEATTATTASTLATSYSTTCGTVAGSWACPLVSPCMSAPSAVSAACAAVTPTLKASSGFCPAAPGLVLNVTPTKQFYAKQTINPQLAIFNLVVNSLFPEARADLFSPLGIASGLAIKFLLTTSKTLGPTIDMYLLAPMNRAIIWGILGALTFVASSATNNVIAQIEANISKIDIILNSMNSMAAGTTATQATLTNPKNAVANKASNILKMNTAQYEDVDLTEAGGGQLPCFTGPDPKNCKSLDSAASGLPGNNLLDKNSQSQLTAILKTANGFNGTSKISKGTLDSAGKLASSAVAFRAAADRAKKLTQDRLKASGSKIDIDAESKKFSNQMEKAINDGLKKSNSTASSMTASMYGGGGAGALNATTADSNASDDKVGAGTASNVAGIVPGTIDLSASGNAMDVDLGGGASLEANKESTPEELAAYNAATKGATSIDEFEIKNDITKDTSSSLFELISNRYQRSGYQRLFKLKEAAEMPVSK